MTITIDDVWIYLRFTGAKTKEIDADWSSEDFDQYFFPCLPIIGDSLDFTDNFTNQGLENLIKDYGTTCFLITQRQFKMNEQEDESPMCYLTIKPFL